MTDQIIIFDTTLRDGEQSPGASMTKEEKIRIAQGGVKNDNLVGHNKFLNQCYRL